MDVSWVGSAHAKVYLVSSGQNSRANVRSARSHATTSNPRMASRAAIGSATVRNLYSISLSIWVDAFHHARIDPLDPHAHTSLPSA